LKEKDVYRLDKKRIIVHVKNLKIKGIGMLGVLVKYYESFFDSYTMKNKSFKDTTREYERLMEMQQIRYMNKLELIVEMIRVFEKTF